MSNLQHPLSESNLDALEKLYNDIRRGRTGPATTQRYALEQVFRAAIAIANLPEAGTISINGLDYPIHPEVRRLVDSQMRSIWTLRGTLKRAEAPPREPVIPVQEGLREAIAAQMRKSAYENDQATGADWNNVHEGARIHWRGEADKILALLRPFRPLQEPTPAQAPREAQPMIDAQTMEDLIMVTDHFCEGRVKKSLRKVREVLNSEAVQSNPREAPLSREEAERLVEDHRVACYLFSEACERGTDSEQDTNHKIMRNAEEALLSHLMGKVEG